MNPHPNRTPASFSQHQRGATLIELMISLTIGLIILAAIGAIFLASRQSFRTQEVLSRMQENARFAFELIDRDIRMTGFSGYASCTASQCNDVTNTAATWWNHKLLTQPLAGYEASLPSDMTATDRVAGDSFSVIRADKFNEYIVASHNTAASPPVITLTNTHSISTGQLVVISNASNTSIFQATAVNQSSKTITHADGDSGPGNCTAELGTLPASCSSTGSVITYPANSSVFEFSANTYYIASNPAGEPSLYRKPYSGNAQELVEGVEDMQISYGVDTSATADQNIDGYVAANAVTDWSKVLGMRISLLMVSRSEELGVSGQQTYTFNGSSYTSTDTKLRKVFTTTIAIRNRL